jgi:SAM-dependent methyltransferase
VTSEQTSQRASEQANEQDRLIRQADTFAADASWLLEQAGVGPGQHVADIGCGPLGIINLLADRVGETGQVVGVDADPPMLVRAQEVVGALGLRNVSLTLADLSDTGLEPSSLDLAHARFVLMHSPEPERVLAEMSALVRPGGTVALEDADWVSWVCQPPHPAWDRLRDALAELAGRLGLDLFIGRRLPGLLRAAGFENVKFRAACPTYASGGNDLHTLLVTLARQFRAALLDQGLLAAGELDDLIAQLDQHLAAPETITIYSLLVQAWARKPVTGPR